MEHLGRFGTYISFVSSVAFGWNNAFRYRCNGGPAVEAVEEHGVVNGKRKRACIEGR